MIYAYIKGYNAVNIHTVKWYVHLLSLLVKQWDQVYMQSLVTRYNKLKQSLGKYLKMLSYKWGKAVSQHIVMH